MYEKKVCKREAMNGCKATCAKVQIIGKDENISGIYKKIRFRGCINDTWKTDRGMCQRIGKERIERNV